MKAFWIGILLTAALHCLWFAYVPGFLFIGISQFVYMLPLMIYAGVAKKPRLLQGLAVGAGVTFLVNAACFGFVLGSF